MNYVWKYLFVSKIYSEIMTWARKCIVHAHRELDDRELK
jgi:hypothetical protein